MGSLVDEVTAEGPSCIYCGSREECPHLVATIDRTFAECTGGALFDHVDRLREVVSDCVLATLKKRKNAAPRVTDSELLSIINNARDKYDPEYTEEVFIEERDFLSWLIDRLVDLGAEEPSGYMIEEGGPGQSSAITLLYALEPDRLIGKIEESLERQCFGAKSKSGDTEAKAHGNDRSDKVLTRQPHSSLSSALHKVDYVNKAPPKRRRVKRRSVLIVITKWPGGTMAFKFGMAMAAALDVSTGDLILLQVAPQRIYRVETTVSEAEFREAMAFRDVECPGKVLFVEIPESRSF